MTTHRRYTKVQKAEAVGLAVIEGQTAASEKTGIPLTTINAWWRSAEFVELRTKSNQDVADDMWAVVQRGIQRIAELIPQTDDIAKVAIATGTIYDKRALLTGDATSRSEHRDIADPDAIAVRKLRERLGVLPPSRPADVESRGNGTFTNGKH